MGRGGEQVFRPPYESKRTRLFGFMLEGSTEALGAMLDRYLNEPSGGAVDYRPASKYVMLYFASLDFTRSAEPPDSMIGWFNEHEVGVFSLAYDAIQDKLVVYVPYIFVEASQTMSGGREVYGFPKQLGEIHMPAAGEASDEFELCARAASSFRPDTQLVNRRVLRVGPNPDGLPRRPLGDAKSAAAAIFSDPALSEITAPDRTALLPSLSTHAGPMTHGVPPLSIRQQSNQGDLDTAAVMGAAAQSLDLAAEVLEGRVPMVFLKQFRDVEYPERACYQAITEVSNKASRYHSAAILDGDITVEFSDLDSHPIMHELGLERGPLKPVVSFELIFDFVVPPGQVLWRAGNTVPS